MTHWRHMVTTPAWGDLIRFDARELNHLGPLFGFVGNDLSEISGGHGHRHAANLAESCLQSGVGQSGVDLSVQPCDDVGRRTLRSHETPPGRCFISWEEIADGWQIG